MDDNELVNIIFRKGLENNTDLLKAKVKDCLLEYLGQYITSNMQRSSSFEEELATLRADIKSKKMKLAEQQKLLAEYQETILKLENDLKQCQEQAEKTDKKRQKLSVDFNKQSAALQEYTDNYGILEEAFRVYSSLGAEVHESLCGILGNGQDRLGLLSGALQEDHLHDFWEYICRAINNDRFNSKQIDALRKLFDLCFDLFNQGGREPAYLRLEILPGSNYDEDLMLPCLSGAKIGYVENIFLAGYKHRLNGNVIKRSLVQLT